MSRTPIRRILALFPSAAFWLTASGIPILWGLTYWGRHSLSPPGWLAVLVVLLPHVYLGLFLFSFLVFLLVLTLRHKEGQNSKIGDPQWHLPAGANGRILFLLPGSLLLSAAFLWGQLLIPQKANSPPQGMVMKTMAWNVQRMRGPSRSLSPSGDGQSCVKNLISAEQPNLLVLLEISRTQLLHLQSELNLRRDQCLWTDYFGTGDPGHGGLAICIRSDTNQLSISSRRNLDLPPGWKYLFAEIQSTPQGTTPTFNLLAIHIAPPQVTDEDVTEALTGIVLGKPNGFDLAWDLVRQYEQRVSLQGTQAISALERIGRLQDPTILAGDFNSTQDAALHRSLRNSLTDSWLTAGFGFGATRHWGGFLPLRIDYIYSTPEFGVREAQTLDSACSDHLPVVSSVFLRSDDG